MQASPFPFPLETATQVADAALVGIERLARLEMHVAWDWLALAREQTASMLADGDAQHGGWPALVQRGSDAALRFNRTCLDTASLRQTELTRIAAEQTAALQRSWLAGARNQNLPTRRRDGNDHVR
jgi:hypothetical protein